MKTSLRNRMNRLFMATAIATLIVQVPSTWAQPTISTQPVGKAVALGSNYTLSVTATGASLAYYWSNGTNTVGTDADTYTITGAGYADAATYNVLVSNVDGTVTSDNAIIVVQAPPSITTPPTATNILATNSTLTLTVAASGDSLYYQWYKANTPITDATNATFAISSVADSDAGTYKVVVTNLVGTVTSSNAVVITVDAPIITQSPTNAVVALGSNDTLSVTATGSYLSYFWTLTNAVGTDSNKYTIVGAQYSDAGPYTVLVSNIAGVVTSAVATITVQASPAITTQPTPTNIVATNSALTLTAAATGDSLYYQWYQGNNAVSGATNTTLVFSSIADSNAGTYKVVVTNLVGKVTSSNAVVITLDAPIITAQPNGTNVVFGSNATLSVTVSGTNLTYYWLLGTNAVGINSNKLTITGAGYGDAGTYSVVVSNIAGTVTSSNVNVAVEVPPLITTQPTATNILATNSTLSLSVVAAGDSLNYQWLKGNSALSNATNATLTISNMADANAGIYTVVVSNLVGKATSSNAVVITLDAPIITTQPKGTNVGLGSNYTMSVTVSGTNLTYYWLQGTNAVGTDSNKFTITGAGYSDAGSYSVLVSNIAGTVTSTNVNLVVEALPVFLEEPVSSSNQVASTVYLGCVAAGDSNGFVWTKGGKALTNGTVTSAFITNVSQYPGGLSFTNTNAFASWITISNAKVADGGSFQVAVSNAVATVKSTNAVLVVVAPPVLSVTKTTVSILSRASGTLTGAATGLSPITYQWSFTNVTNVLAGATNKSYTITNMTTNLAGVYTLSASNFGGVSTTNITVDFVADTNPPVFTVAGTSGKFTNAAITLNGKATDNVAVSNVVFYLASIINTNTNATFVNATTTNAWTNFVISSTFTNLGSNVLVVKAQDVNGNYSSNTYQLTYAPYFTLQITNVGYGTYTSNWTSAGVQFGTTYTAVAKPATGNLLQAWTGDLATNGATIKFSPTNNMTATVTFVTNAFLGAAGTYSGLFSGTNTSLTNSTGGTNLVQSGGYLTLTIQTNLSYSGKIYVQGVSGSLSGSMSPNGSLQASNAIAKGGPTVILDLSLLFSNKAVVGDILTSNWESTNFEAGLALSPSTNVGTYTFVVPTDTNTGIGASYACGTVTVASNGTVTLVGVAADGSLLSQSTTLSEDTYWPLYVALYPTNKVDNGLLMGWTEFTTNGPIGYMDWVSYVPGSLVDSFTNIISSSFTKPASGDYRLFTNDLAQITFYPAGTTNTITEIMAIADDGSIGTDGAAKIAISLNGIISGTMVDSYSEKTNKIFGIVLQHDYYGSLGRGTIAATNGLGNFIISPYP